MISSLDNTAKNRRIGALVTIAIILATVAAIFYGYAQRTAAASCERLMNDLNTRKAKPMIAVQDDCKIFKGIYCESPEGYEWMERNSRSKTNISAELPYQGDWMFFGEKWATCSKAQTVCKRNEEQKCEMTTEELDDCRECLLKEKE